MKKAGVSIRDANVGDSARIGDIYQYYVRDTIITFEYDDVSAVDMSLRIAKVMDAGLPWLVIEVDGVIHGFAYAAPFRERSAYMHSVETTIYLDHSARGRGLGIQLYRALVARLQELDVHLAVALIALPNDASLSLHDRMGFARAGTLTEVGRKFDRWIDVTYAQLLIDG